MSDGTVSDTYAGDIAVEIVPENDKYPWCADRDERRRAFVANLMATEDCTNAESASELVSAMHIVEEYVRNGKVKKAALRVIGKKTDQEQ